MLWRILNLIGFVHRKKQKQKQIPWSTLKRQPNEANKMSTTKNGCVNTLNNKENRISSIRELWWFSILLGGCDQHLCASFIASIQHPSHLICAQKFRHQLFFGSSIYFARLVTAASSHFNGRNNKNSEMLKRRWRCTQRAHTICSCRVKAIQNAISSIWKLFMLSCACCSLFARSIVPRNVCVWCVRIFRSFTFRSPPFELENCVANTIKQIQ